MFGWRSEKGVYIARLISLILVIALSGSFSVYTYKKDQENIKAYIKEAYDKFMFPVRLAELQAASPDDALVIPIEDISKSEITDTWGASRSGGRSHEGVDIFAERGTPIYSATDGYVIRKGHGKLGGNYVYVLGAGGRRYYYAHLDSFREDLKIGEKVSIETVLGYVGNTGNAAGTPAHLHFGMYLLGAQNPYELLIER